MVLIAKMEQLDGPMVRTGMLRLGVFDARRL